MFVLIKLVKYSTKKKKTIAFFEQKLDLSRQIFTDNPSELNLIYAQTYKFLSLTIKFLGVIIKQILLYEAKLFPVEVSVGV